MKTLSTVLPILLVLCSSLSATPSQPNILFFFADDQRFDALGCAGHLIVQTPTIDHLAAEGVRFRNAFVGTPVCWVSRSMLLTGRSARAHADPAAIPQVRPEALATIYPVELRKAGYRTGFYGKWHMIAPPGFNPSAQFDEFRAITRNPYFKKMPDGSLRHETDLVADGGIEFLKSQPKDRPFCLNLWFNAPHAEDSDRRPGIGQHPWPQSADGLYEDRIVPDPRLGAASIYEAHPQFLKDSINRQRFFWGYDTPEKYQANLRAYFRMLTGIDHAVARVIAALEAAGLADNTIIVYSGDNGYYLGDRGFQGKWSHFEESLRVPLIIYDPRVPTPHRGRVDARMTTNLDLPATFLDWAGAPRPAGYEGRSLAPIVADQPVAEWRTHFFCEHLDLAPTLTWEGIRGERYVYARYFDQSPTYEFLYDLRSDPDELRNLATEAASADLLKQMRSLCDTEVNARGAELRSMSERGAKKSATKKAKSE